MAPCLTLSKAAQPRRHTASNRACPHIGAPQSTRFSPFAKRQYVSHTIGDHTSLLASIEKRFLKSAGAAPQRLTLRDHYANTLEDMFDFDKSPSLHTPVGTAAPPIKDCTPTNRAGSLAIALRRAMQR
jgi:phospholipase C